MGFMNTSVSGLLSAQRALATTSHNIANVNTPGYSRQRVDLLARDPQFTGAGYVGRGVGIASIQRVHSDFISEQVRTSTASASANEAFFTLSNRIDTLLSDENAGLSPSLVSFFNAVQDVVDVPSSINTRQVMISEGQSLVNRFNYLYSRLQDVGSEISTQLSVDINSANTLSQSIADLNARIVSASGNPNSQPVNDLLDQRDELIRQMSELVAVTTVEQVDGALNVFAGSGQPLVLGGIANTLQVVEPYQGRYEVSVVNNFGSTTITESLTGGSIGGLLNFQEQVLEPTVNSLGRLAIMTDVFNDQHNLGRNLDGEVNTDFFSVASADVVDLSSSAGAVSAAIVDPTQLTTSNYNLTYNGGNSYTLVRLSDDTTTAINTGGASPFTTTTIDGFTLTLTAGGTAGDQFLIRPTALGARDIAMNISDPRKIAAAGALKTGEVTDGNGLPTNTGTAQITAASNSNLTGIPLAGPVTLTFVQATNQFTISAPPGGTLAYNPATENNGKEFTIAGIGNATFTISGLPDDGDQFTISNNTNSDGDNRNALLLSDLQNSGVSNGGNSGYLDTFNQLVVEVATQTQQAEVSQGALNSLLAQATEARESLSGVNLDEEAANMLELQQMYQASARMIATADALFQSLIDAV